MTGEDNRPVTSQGSMNDTEAFRPFGAPAPAFTQLGVPPGLPFQREGAGVVTHAQLGVPPGVSTQSAFQTAVPVQRFPPNTATQSTGPPIFGQHLAPNIPAQNTDHSYALNPFFPSTPDGPLKVEQNPSPRTPTPVGALTRQPLAPISVPGLFQRASTQPTSFQDLSAQSAARASVAQDPKAPMFGHPSSARHPAATVTRQPLTPRPEFGASASRQPLAPIIAPGLFQRSGSSSAPASTAPVPVVDGTTTQPGRITGALGAPTTTPAPTATATSEPVAPTPGTTATPTPAAAPTPAATTTPASAAPIPTAALATPTPAPSTSSALAAPTPAATTTPVPATPIPTAALAAPTPAATTIPILAAPTPTTIPAPTAPVSTGTPIETGRQLGVTLNVPPATGGSNQQAETTVVQQRLPPRNMLAWRSKGIIGVINNHSIGRLSTLKMWYHVPFGAYQFYVKHMIKVRSDIYTGRERLIRTRLIRSST